MAPDTINVYARQLALEGELESGARIDGGADFLRQAFKDIVPRRTITRFLNQSKLYDTKKKRWHILPFEYDFKERLDPKIHKILKDILKYRPFVAEDRKLVCCEDHNVKYERTDLCSHEQDPEFMILGRGGRSFKERKFPTSPTYSQCVSFIRVTADHNSRTLQSQMTLMATYARQCFIEQHNRIRVYAVVLTESTMWLFQYDRAGITYSSSCNIHDDPYTFVRIILGLVSSEAQVGFDTSIFWERGKRWISTRNHKGRRVVYLVKGDNPIAHRNTLIGNATHCWQVVDPYTGKEYIIKDVWHLVDDDPEVSFLEMAKGLPGVGQLVAMEEDHTKTTPYFRGCDMADHLPTDRAWCRLSLEAYGTSIGRFDDGLQLLEAYKDIVLAILQLWERNILHRDISINNTLFGKENALPGSRGILIDLDRAARIDVEESLQGANSDIGTRAFQSVAVLRSESLRVDSKAAGRVGLEPHPHDYLDDMESLFYILCWICYHFDSPGVRSNGIPDNMKTWSCDDPDTSACGKSLFLMFPLPPLPPYFQRGSAYQHLLETLQKKFLNIYRFKTKGLEAADRDPGRNLKEVCKQARLDLELFVEYIDRAIEEWKRDIPDPPREPTPQPTYMFATPEEMAEYEANFGVPKPPIQVPDPTQDSESAHRTKRDRDGDDTVDPPAAASSKRRKITPTTPADNQSVQASSPQQKIPPSPPRNAAVARTSRRLRERKKPVRS